MEERRNEVKWVQFCPAIGQVVAKYLVSSTLKLLMVMEKARRRQETKTNKSNAAR